MKEILSLTTDLVLLIFGGYYLSKGKIFKALVMFSLVRIMSNL